MKKSIYFRSKEELDAYFGEDGVPSGFLAIVQPDSETEASLYTSSNNSPINPGQSESQGGDTPEGYTYITENGDYDIASYAYANVNVEGGGSNTISSVSVYDEGSEIGTYLTTEDIDGVDYFTYEFRMDTTTYTNKNFVVECTVGEDNYYLSQGVYISDPGDNGEYFTENHQVLNSWSGSIYNQLGSDWTGDQPNAYVDVKLYLKSIQDVSGWYTGFEYEVSGYEKQDTITIYSYNDGTGEYDTEMNTLYLNSSTGNFESDGLAMVVGNVRFYHSTYGWLNPQSNEVIANNGGQVIVDDLSSSENGHFEFDLWNYDLSISVSDGQADPPTFELTATPDEDTTFNVVVNDSTVGMISLNQTINQSTTQGDIIQFEMLGGTVSFDTNSDPQLNGNTLSVVLDIQGTGSQTYNAVTADGGNYNISLLENNGELSVVFTPYV